MAIRKNTNPREMDLQPEMRDILMRNGMQAHIISVGDGYQLAVQGHDSPLITYPISQKQMLTLTDWGTGFANKKAYNAFAGIVGNDFYMPRNFVSARNANGRVAMGLHGYRIGAGEYGRMGYHHNFLGWTPRQQEGFHLRRVGGQMFYAGAPMVAERPDGRLKPGELRSGNYGFYWKGQQTVQPQADVLQSLQAVVISQENRPRNMESGKPYKELITSPVYFSNEKWQECLTSHGIILDEKNKTLTIQSTASNSDMIYDVTDEELKVLACNDVKTVPVDKRLETLNNIIKGDFSEKITMNALNSKEQLSIQLRPEVQQELDSRLQPVLENSPVEKSSLNQASIDHNIGIVDGRELQENKGWFREGAHGREVEVGEISVQPSEGQGKYKMTAVINGEHITHEITQKQYDKFMAVDDYHRMKLFSKVFSEVDMKGRGDGVGLGVKISAALLAGVAVVGELGRGISGPPEFYEEHHHHRGPDVNPYFKPGVDTPMDVAARNYEAAANADAMQHELHHGM